MTDSGVNRHRNQGGLAAAGLSDERGKLRRLLLDFGGRWEIEQGAAWVACTHNGSFTHVIAAHTLDDLRAKIEPADQADRH
jgi:hypothetical protein